MDENNTSKALHGHEDLAVLPSTTAFDKASLAHTSIPVPAQLTVRPSPSHCGQLGVFATTLISKDVKMGPYVGKRVNIEDIGNTDLQYAWEVSVDISILIIRAFKIVSMNVYFTVGSGVSRLHYGNSCPYIS